MLSPGLHPEAIPSPGSAMQSHLAVMVFAEAICQTLKAECGPGPWAASTAPGASLWLCLRWEKLTQQDEPHGLETLSPC